MGGGFRGLHVGICGGDRRGAGLLGGCGQLCDADGVHEAPVVSRLCDQRKLHAANEEPLCVRDAVVVRGDRHQPVAYDVPVAPAADVLPSSGGRVGCPGGLRAGGGDQQPGQGDDGGAG